MLTPWAARFGCSAEGVWLEGGPLALARGSVLKDFCLHSRPQSGLASQGPSRGPWHEPVGWVPQSACVPFGISRGSCVRAVFIVCLRLLAPAHIRQPGRCQSVCYFSGARVYVPAGTDLHLHSGVLAFTGWPSDTYRWGAKTNPRYRMTWRTPHDICS